MVASAGINLVPLCPGWTMLWKPSNHTGNSQSWLLNIGTYISPLPAQVNAIRDSSLARVLCENGDDIQLMQPLVFKAATDMWVRSDNSPDTCTSRSGNERDKKKKARPRSLIVIDWATQRVEIDSRWSALESWLQCDLDGCNIMGKGELIDDQHTPKLSVCLREH